MKQRTRKEPTWKSDSTVIGFILITSSLTDEVECLVINLDPIQLQKMEFNLTSLISSDILWHRKLGIS